jgi:hypothetical protein
MKPSDQPTIKLIQTIEQLGTYVQQQLPKDDQPIFQTYWSHVEEICRRIRKYEGIPDNKDT